ncbi:hypothetical protein [Rhodovarius lipocyclicus]|uniref:hypothetical protein n=1 Tax=Rhodovarius lipocyclicus TaxID=268410 RepID=UPI00135730ED|nr:hypothetical protein [Rhodovarius lipocyclicus]
MPDFDPLNPPRMKIDDYEAFGKLVKTWSTQDSKYFGKVYPVPRSLAEFKAQCAEAGVGLSLPDFLTGFSVAMFDNNTVYVRIPPKERVLASEGKFAAGGSYNVPSFYGDLAFGGATPAVDPADRMKFHASRIGDYTISYCE